MSVRTALAAVVAWALLFGITGFSVGYGVWTAVSCAFTTIVLLVTMMVAGGGRLQTLVVLFLPYWLIGTVNIDVEGIFFDIFPLTAGFRLLAVGLLSALAVSAVFAYLSGPGNTSLAGAAPRLHAYWQLRFLVVGFAYVILFFVAGMLVFPYVSHFYSGRVMPSIQAIIGVEFVRGLIYGLAMLPVARQLEGHRWRAAAVLGLCVSVFGGVAPLLLPNNKYLPADILPYHLVEVGCENFLLGMMGAWLFVAKRPKPEFAAASSKPVQKVMA
jgi:hypothetical protein